MKFYDVGNRDILEQDRAGGYYFRHVQALTAEALHSKSDIAAELAAIKRTRAQERDYANVCYENEQLRAALTKAADTFEDFSKGLRLLNRPLLADACDIALQESRAVLNASETKGEQG